MANQNDALAIGIGLGEGDLERGGQALEDVGRHRPAGLDAAAEVALHDLPHVDPELHDQRLVEPVLRPDLRHLLRRGVLPRQRRGGIVGHDAHQDEGQDEQPEQDRNDEQDAPDEKPDHRGRRGRVGAPSDALTPPTSSAARFRSRPART